MFFLSSQERDQMAKETIKPPSQIPEMVSSILSQRESPTPPAATAEHTGQTAKEAAGTKIKKIDKRKAKGIIF